MTRRAASVATADDVLRYVAGYLEARDAIPRAPDGAPLYFVRVPQ